MSPIRPNSELRRIALVAAETQPADLLNHEPIPQAHWDHFCTFTPAMVLDLLDVLDAAFECKDDLTALKGLPAYQHLEKSLEPFSLLPGPNDEVIKGPG